MNRILHLVALLIALLPALASAQLTVSLRMNPRPSPYLSDWEQRHETVMLTIVNRSDQMIAARVDARVRQSSRVLASTDINAVPVLSLPPGTTLLNASDILPASAVRIDPAIRSTAVRSGMLPAGNYELCVRLLPAGTGITFPEEACHPFIMTAYQQPVAIQPASGAQIRTGTDRPLFRWTPVTPDPGVPVRYTLKIYEVLPGQSGAESVGGNAPIFRTEVDRTTAVLWPPELSVIAHPGEYLWSIEAVRADGSPIGTMLGSTSPHRFTLTDPSRIATNTGTGGILLSPDGEPSGTGGAVANDKSKEVQDPNCQHTTKEVTEWGEWHEDADGTKWREGTIFIIDECTMKKHATTKTKKGTIRESVTGKKTTTTKTVTNRDGSTTTTVVETEGKKTKKTTTEKDKDGNTTKETVEEGGKTTTTDYKDGKKSKVTESNDGKTTTTDYTDGEPSHVTVKDKNGKTTDEWKRENGKWYKKKGDTWKEDKKGPPLPK